MATISRPITRPPKIAPPPYSIANFFLLTPSAGIPVSRMLLPAMSWAVVDRWVALALATFDCSDASRVCAVDRSLCSRTSLLVRRRHALVLQLLDLAV